VDQEELKLALVLNAVNPSIGGLLIRGPKGSGKSMAVRALVELLPDIEVVKDCPFNCNPHDAAHLCRSCREKLESGKPLETERRPMRLITLPLGATEDRVVGTLDIERVLKDGVRAIQPGILAEVNQSILYVDEINLLPDHLVDDLLDAAASGWNVVERETISLAHPSRFILIGTMNPEEGELRPQLLDRLAISINLMGINDAHQRVEVIARNLEFKRDPIGFRKEYEAAESELKARVVKARERLPKVHVSKAHMFVAAQLCLSLGVDGQRPDIVIAETARTIAAWEGRTEMHPTDVLQAARFALGHRTRRGGFDAPATAEEIEKAFREAMLQYEAARMKYTKDEEEAKRRGKPESGAAPSLGPPSADSDKARERLPAAEATREQSTATTLRVEPRAPEGGKTIEDQRGDRDEDRGLQAALGTTKRFLGRVKASSFSRLFRRALLAERVRSRTPRLPRSRAFHMNLLEPSGGLRKIAASAGRKVFAGMRTIVEGRLGILPRLKQIRRVRSHLAGKRGISVTSLSRGRYVSYEKPERLTPDVAFVPTIQAAAVRGKKKADGLLEVSAEDVRTKVRVYRAPLTLVLVLDISGSMMDVLPFIAKTLPILNREAYKMRDRVAVVALKENAAYVLSHPTTNLTVVAGKIRRLGAVGYTPLADGLMKALEVIVQDRRKNMDVIPVIILISDCQANIPLQARSSLVGLGGAHTTLLPVSWIASACADALYVARLLKQHRIPVVVITPIPHVAPLAIRLPYLIDQYGSELAEQIASITGGTRYLFSYERRLFIRSSKRLEEIFLSVTHDRSLVKEARSPGPSAYGKGSVPAFLR